MLTIGELARLAGTTARAIRHYHAVGLLAEPGRDASGYRRYGPHALVRLVRIRRLRDLGVPLERIRGVLDADLGYEQALDALDDDLARQAAEIAEQRRALARLRERHSDPELPEPLALAFGKLRAQGFDQASLDRERDAILLILAMSPDTADQLTELYRQMLDESGIPPRMLAMNGRFLALADVDADDPAVATLADEVLADPELRRELDAAGEGDTDARTLAMLGEFIATYAPAQRRFLELVVRGAEDYLAGRR